MDPVNAPNPPRRGTAPTPRPQARRSLLAALGAVALALALAGAIAGCGTDDGPTGAAPAATDPGTELAATTTFPRPRCTPESLTDAARVTHPGARLSEVGCSSTFALATIHASDQADGAAFFAAGPNGWTLIKVAPAADAAGQAPDGFPVGLITTWRELRQPAPSTTRKPTTTTTRAATRSGGGTG